MSPTPGDQARVSVLVAVPPAEAFRIFTEEINAWWRAGLRYRLGKRRSVLHLEPKLGGRLFETFQTAAGGEKVRETGRITRWQPPTSLLLEWRAVNFAAEESTEVEVTFAASLSGTLVTVEHRGWARIRPDHPARHGQGPPAFLREMGMWWSGLMSALREHVAPKPE